MKQKKQRRSCRNSENNIIMDWYYDQLWSRTANQWWTERIQRMNTQITQSIQRMDGDRNPACRLQSPLPPTWRSKSSDLLFADQNSSVSCPALPEDPIPVILLFYFFLFLFLDRDETIVVAITCRLPVRYDYTAVYHSIICSISHVGISETPQLDNVPLSSTTNFQPWLTTMLCQNLKRILNEHHHGSSPANLLIRPFRPFYTPHFFLISFQRMGRRRPVRLFLRWRTGCGCGWSQCL